MKVKKMTNEEISILCMELSLLLQAGIDVGEGLYLLADDSGDQRLRDMADGLAEGGALADAMRSSCSFPDYVCGLIAVGERTGRLEEALRALTAYYDGRDRMARNIRGALIYPAVLFTMMLAVIVILLTKVLPVFNDVYASLGSGLTGTAGALLWLGGRLDAAMPLLCVLLALVLLFLAAFALSDRFRDALLAFFNRRRRVRGVSGQIAFSRIAQSLAMGLRSGLTAEEALQLSSQLVGDIPAVSAKIEQCLNHLAKGGTLAGVLQEAGILPQSYCRMLELAQRSGNSDNCMEEIARRLSENAEEALERRVSRIEPALVIITSLLVGAILLSVMLPLMHIMSAIGI